MAKPKPAPKPKPDKPYNGGTWTQSRFNAFITSTLRGARWPVKYECLRRAFVRDGINPKTGRKCKLHRCNHCADLFPQKDIQIDHIVPVVGPEGFTNWDDYIRRMFPEIEGLQALCKPCHKIKTAYEQSTRMSGAAQNGHPESPQAPAADSESRPDFGP